MMDDLRMDCPVCPARDLDPGVAVCPSCGTDLGPLLRVRELAAAAAGGVSSGAGLPWVAKLTLAVLALWVPISAVLLVGMRESGPSTGEEEPVPARGEALSPEGSVVAPATGAAALVELRAFLEGIEGATATIEGGNVRVVFDDEIFASGGDIPTAPGLALLRGAGRILRRLAAGREAEQEFMVDVLGASDDRPTRPEGPWKDNWSLALGRARAAVEVLHDEAGDAPIRWRVSSAGEGGAPWPNDSEASRARNRTVVLYVAGASEPLIGGGNPDQP